MFNGTTHHDRLSCIDCTVSGTLAASLVSFLSDLTFTNGAKAIFRNSYQYINSPSANNLKIAVPSLAGTVSIEGGEIALNANDGNPVSIVGGDAVPASGSAGGDVEVFGGDGDGASAGGDVDIISGDGGATGTGGSISIIAGTGGATSGTGGDIDINAGDGGTEGAGGSVDIVSGDAKTAGAGNFAGGAINILTGFGVGSGAQGALGLDCGNLTADVNGEIEVISSDHTHIDMQANDAGDKALSLSASNAGAGNGNIEFNADNINITGDTLISSDDKIQFRAVTEYIQSPSAGQLNIVANTELELAVPLVDVNADVSVSGMLNLEKMSIVDDFEGNLLGNLWTTGGTDVPTIRTANCIGGQVRLDTSAVANHTSILNFSNQIFNTNASPALEARIVSRSAITNQDLWILWRSSPNDYAGFKFDTAVDATKIFAVSNNNGAGEVATDTGVTLSADVWLKAMVKINDDGTLAFYLDGVQVAGAHAGTVRHLHDFVPYFMITNKAVAQQNIMDIDYAKMWQNRISIATE